MFFFSFLRDIKQKTIFFFNLSFIWSLSSLIILFNRKKFLKYCWYVLLLYIYCNPAHTFYASCESIEVFAGPICNFWRTKGARKNIAKVYILYLYFNLYANKFIFLKIQMKILFNFNKKRVTQYLEQTNLEQERRLPCLSDGDPTEEWKTQRRNCYIKVGYNIPSYLMSYTVLNEICAM